MFNYGFPINNKIADSDMFLSNEKTSIKEIHCKNKAILSRWNKQ